MSSQTGFVIAPVETGDELEIVKTLFRAYVDWLDIDLSYQGIEEELHGMPGKYAPPEGALFLAKDRQGIVLGCVGLRRFDEGGTCEMKRLYVLPEGRGLGVGGALVEQILDTAVLAGYRSMVLDTLPTMTGAIKLYTAAGFEQIDAYYETPIKETLFFRKILADD
ncbi:GNAT family N-acetyltransferase [Roseibium sp. SCPC15]|uniref:GNAT family N-acetyltransferase n=1 Tax=Roseibium sp. SCP15 TaxID=3141376 RepID=UPI003339742D